MNLYIILFDENYHFFRKQTLPKKSQSVPEKRTTVAKEQSYQI